MSKATAAAPPSTANEVPIDRPPRRQSPPTFDCRAATIKPQTTPLRDNHAPSIMPPPRRRIPILIVAAFSSRSPRDSTRCDRPHRHCSGGQPDELAAPHGKSLDPTARIWLNRTSPDMVTNGGSPLYSSVHPRRPHPG